MPDSQFDTLASGRYEIVLRVPAHLHLRRNLYYGGPSPGRFKEIIYRFGEYPSQIRLELTRRRLRRAADRAFLRCRLEPPWGVRDPSSRPGAAVAAWPEQQRPLTTTRSCAGRQLRSTGLSSRASSGTGGATPADSTCRGFRATSHRNLSADPDLATARRLARGHLRDAIWYCVRVGVGARRDRRG